jgi:tetratricopeptide (TPR) repeat protein
VLSVPEIARRLGDRFALLRGGVRGMPERHRTLHAVVEWSWNLLAQDARAALRTLSVFPGGFGGDAAERVLGEDALLLLEQLAGQSLLTVAETPAGVRFRMLETVREFSAARRAEAGGDEEAVGRFLAWARDFGVAYHDALFGSDAQAAWERIKAEQDNLVLALRHALARTDHPAIAAVTAVLASLWSTGTSFPRLAALAADTGPPLSHYRPEPEYVEVARTAAVLGTATVFMGPGPRAIRQLVTLRRLPPAPPDTLMRATAVVLSAIPEIRPPDYDVLRGLCEGESGSEQPLLSGIAECVACYVWEFEHDIDRALASARRMVVGLAPVDNPSVQLMVHSRLSELCLRTGRGEEAYEHLKAALKVLPRLGDGHDYISIRSLLVFACLQRGETDEAEDWLRQAESDNTPQQDDFYRPDLCGRAEIALARGLTEVGLGLWRGVVERMLAAGSIRGGDARIDPWVFLIQSVAVTAHAHADRLALVAEVVDRLRQRLRTLLCDPVGSPSELPLFGTMLHALGMVGLASGDTGAVRLIALAERLGVLREFQPTMSADRARRAAEDADRAAYADAVSEYTALERDELREAARAVMAVTSGRG